MLLSVPACRALLCACIATLLGTGLTAVNRAGAQTGFATSRFALSPSDFPPGARIDRSQVEANALADRDRLTAPAQTWTQLGRTSGYLQQATQPFVDVNGVSHPVVTVYLVSIFGAAAQATMAESYERQGWVHAQNRRPAGITAVTRQPSLAVGDRGQSGAYRMHDAVEGSVLTVTEWFFARGAVLIQIWQYEDVADQAGAGQRAASLLPSLARELDAIAIAAPTPPRPALAVLALRSETAQVGAGFWTAHVVQRVSRGHSVRVALYAWIQLPAGEVVAHVTLVVQSARGRRQLDLHQTVGEGQGRRYRFAAVLTLSDAGRYRISGRFVLAGLSVTRTATLTVV